MSLRIGFLGYGFMGTAHANALARLPMFFPDAPSIDRTVLVGRDREAAADAADRLGFGSAITDWREALDAIDVLYNLGPNHAHADPSTTALQDDVHVLCEKPLATDAESADRMADAARNSDAVAGVGFNYRYVPALRYANALIEAGELGAVRSFEGRYLQDWLLDPAEPWSWRTDAEKAGGGALGDLGSHVVDLGRFLVGDVATVTGNRRTFVEERPDPAGDGTRQVTNDDTTTAQLTFENGALGSLEVSRATPGHKNDLSIAVRGETGSLAFSLERLNELRVHRSGERGYERVLVTEESDPYLEHWWPPGHVLGWEHAFVHQSYEFLSAVASGGSYRPNFQDGAAVQRALSGIVESDDTGEVVAVS